MGCRLCFFTFSFQLFGISEDEAIQEPDEGEVLQRVARVLNGFSLQEQTPQRTTRLMERDTNERSLPGGWWLQTETPTDGNAEQAAQRRRLALIVVFRCLFEIKSWLFLSLN